MTDEPTLSMVDELPPDDSPIPGLNEENYCAQCDRTFDTLRGLRRHQTVIHGSSDKPPRTTKQRQAPLKPALVNTLQVVSFGVMFVNETDAQIIATNTEQLAEAWAKLAQHNAKVDRILRALTSGTEYGEVIAATLATVLPILANHNILPQQFQAMFLASAKLNGQSE